MSETRIKKGCDGKMKHPTETAAVYHIEHNDKIGIEDYYKCRFCDNFHTFTLPGKKKLSHKRHFRNHELSNNRGPRKMKLFGRDRNGHKRNK